jgi:NitT/TauT family transport system substrate-binding protein
MKTITKITLGIIFVLLVLILIFSFNFNKLTGHVVKENTKVRIGYLPIVQGLPLYMAIEKGYFKDSGIDVEAIKFDSPNQIVDALMQNNLDFGSPIDNSDDYITSKSEFSNKTISKKGDLIKEIVYSTALGITGVADYKNPGKLKIYAVAGGTEEVPNENLMVPIDSNLTSIKDLKGKKLGILAGTIQWRTITREVLAQNGLDMDKDVTIVEL